MKKQRFYYVEECRYGRITYESLNGGAYSFYAFKSKKDRDDYVNTNNYADGNEYVGAITAAELREALSRVNRFTSHEGFRYALTTIFGWNGSVVYEVIPVWDALNDSGAIFRQ